MRWAFLKCVKIILGGMVFGLISCTSAHAWSLNAPPSFQVSNVKVFQSNPCSGNFEFIAVSGEGSINACVMGNNTRVASYFPAQGGVAYAVSFPFDDAFYRLDICGEWGCVYSEENDTFLGLSYGYKHFVENLKKSVQNGIIHYSPNENTQVFSFTRFGNLSLSGQAVALSHNGKWALVEIKSYGIFRINTQTQEMRRIIAPGFNYGYGYDPRVEMAISNDGKTAAIMGLRMGVWIVVVDDTCGDHPNEFMQTQYVGAVTPCRFVPTPTDQYIQGFTYALMPRFSQDDTNLSFNIYSNGGAPRHVTLFSTIDASSINSNYLAIGDSFTSGEGEIDDAFYVGGATNRCHVSTRSYPFLLAHTWNIPGHSVACSGATIDTARSKGSDTTQSAQLSELESHPSKVTTIGIGGNDAGLIGKLKTCLGLDTCEWAETPEARKNTALEIKNLYPRLKDFYKDVKARTLGSVIVVGYPRIIFSDGDCASPIGILLNQTERTFMNEAVHYLNQVIQAAASDSEVEYVDVEEAFVGGELCTSYAPPFMNGIRIGDDYPDVTALPFLKIIGAESFHPTPDGHVKVASRVLQIFPNVDDLDLCSTCTGSTSVPSPGSYWDGPEITPKTQRAASFLKKVTIKKGDSFEISFPALSFEPSSDVVLELHSNVQNLGTVHSAQDGSLMATIPTIDLDSGFHSVHAIGKSFTGGTIDSYDFLAIEDEDTSVGSVNTTSSATPTSTMIPTDSTVSTKLPSSNISRAVLGASSVTIPASLSKNATVKSLMSHPSTSKKPLNNLVIAFGVSVVLVVIGVSGYVYYRQK
jgi:lysophospholipase L1-like esterase